MEVEPRRMWPTGMPALGIDLKGRIPANQQCSTGRALGRLSDIGWGNRLRPLLAENAPDGPVPDDVLKAAVAVLADWARSTGAGRRTSRMRPPGRWESSLCRPWPARSWSVRSPRELRPSAASPSWAP